MKEGLKYERMAYVIETNYQSGTYRSQMADSEEPFLSISGKSEPFKTFATCVIGLIESMEEEGFSFELQCKQSIRELYKPHVCSPVFIFKREVNKD